MPYDRQMGPLASGWTPPFSPSGKSSIWRSKGPGYTGVQMAHAGVLVRYEADAERLATLLPAPFEATGRTGEVGLFVNTTRAVPVGFEDDPDCLPAEPFREALLIFPCRLGERELMFHWIMYTDSDWAFYTGVVGGLSTKLAEFDFTHAKPPHPLRDVEVRGAGFRATVSRGGRPLISLRFTAGREVAPDAVFADAGDIVGMRYIPDLTNRTEDRPLVHDVVLSEPVDPWFDGAAHDGDAELELGDQPTEELEAFQPGRILSARSIEGFGYRNLGRKVIYDYLANG